MAGFPNGGAGDDTPRAPIESPPPPQPVTFTCTLSRAQAIALAQLCKRIGWRDCKELSATDSELYAMLSATDFVRGALADAGVDVR